MKFTPLMPDYSRPLRRVHRIMAVILVTLLISGLAVPEMADTNELKWLLRESHESLGIIVIPLLLLRLWLRLSSPAHSARLLHYPNWMYWLSRWVHFSFYLLMLLLPVAGWLAAHPYGIELFGLYLADLLPDAVTYLLLLDGAPDFYLAGVAFVYHKQGTNKKQPELS
ncbi:cytochrome b/b6 domain-containing protein [Shewanella submarina]|uniref:Cytochrome b n=1 Tax=Shewanella submarina TaxID=2016376 RepID=A0ABV7G5R4_9GAMM|nr:cytochrome b/b6 domain-containing protein [Shewanella submarina]MCL1038522.1 cytochrome b/b6 domain-containing protein [Shewanella submarina]